MSERDDLTEQVFHSPTPDELKAAQAAADKQFPELVLAPENEQRADDYAEGHAAAQAAARDRAQGHIDLARERYDTAAEAATTELEMAIAALPDGYKIVPEDHASDLSSTGGVELGAEFFTHAQWDVLQAYAKGYHITQQQDTDLTRDNRFSSRAQNQVEEFHRAMGQPVGDRPRMLPEGRKKVRVELIREEFIDELIPALASDDYVETVDAAIDILYVTYGLLVEMGVDAQPLFDEVQRSNMSKLGEDGQPIIAGPNDPDGIFPGRVKKGPNYSRPDIAGVLSALADEADLHGEDPFA